MADLTDSLPLQDEIAALRILNVRDSNDLDRAVELSRQALTRLQHNTFVSGLLYLNLGVVLRRNGNVTDAAQAFREAVRLCDHAGNTMAAMTVTYNVARLYGLLGQLHRAAAVCQQALDSACRPAGSALRCSPGLGLAYLGLAGVEYEWNQLEVAEQHTREAITLGEPGGYLGILMNGYSLLALIRQASGDSHGANAAMDALKTLVAQREILPTTMDELATSRRPLSRRIRPFLRPLVVPLSAITWYDGPQAGGRLEFLETNETLGFKPYLHCDQGNRKAGLKPDLTDPWEPRRNSKFCL